MTTKGAELIIGLVSPVGMDTGGLAIEVQGALADYEYKTVILKLSDLLPTVSIPAGESEDQRINRLVEVGNTFCANNNDSASIARLAVSAIREHRIALLRSDGDTRRVGAIKSGRPRTAYILQSLKRREEVQLLREVYGTQFILIGSQSSVDKRTQTLLRRNLSASENEEKKRIVEKLIQLDADDHERFGQNVTDTYPQADFFIRDNSRDEIDRIFDLLFGAPESPTIGEYAMYIARASRARSLAASRKVGAAIVVEDAVIATGYNDVPHGQTPDVKQGTDTSEQFKRDSLRDTIDRLNAAGLLAEGVNEDVASTVDKAAVALKGGELMSVIEYQRAVHAEASAIDDATVRGVSPRGGTLYVTTYPCHLCYKHALSARLSRVEYIEPYPKSRAVSMFSEGADEVLVPFAGVAPRRYLAIFDDRPAFKSDPSGIFPKHNRRVANPLLESLRQDEDIAASERTAVNGLKEEYQQ
ncbi:deaminase [Rhodococcus sp. AD45]|uniref:deaminase n=1 Tax=Rhodococcus sp. (strain AD45) TaxID=103808 RepID=UPI0005E14D11|nr:deaminase [Rhodococcus sp. AD45]KJF19116.1 ComE operon protein 2 [Rhodococcus sp. AD45]